MASTMAFRPCGVVTLTTDFGHKGPYTASMKGVILTRFAGAKIVDLTHESMVHWPAEAGFWLRRAYRYFPVGTVHVAVVDPGVGTQRDIIAAVCDGHLFLAPDNGLLASLLSATAAPRVHRLDTRHLQRFGIDAPSATFHGRDVFAPLGAELAAGSLAPEALGPELAVHEIVPAWTDEAALVRGEAHGSVITFDHFGNIITNVDQDLLRGMRTPIVRLAGHDFSLVRTYGEAKPGEYLALINSFGVVEVARAESSAHDGLGAERGAPVVVRDAAAS
jgi:S-adenosylmethionine hydrolase